MSYEFPHFATIHTRGPVQVEAAVVPCKDMAHGLEVAWVALKELQHARFGALCFGTRPVTY